MALIKTVKGYSIEIDTTLIEGQEARDFDAAENYRMFLESIIETIGILGQSEERSALIYNMTRFLLQMLPNDSQFEAMFSNINKDSLVFYKRAS